MGIDFEVIVVGGGLAGSAAALTLARNGVDVALLEKSQVPGERNSSGGVLYTEYVKGYSFGDVFPNFERDAPWERKMISHEVWVLSDALVNDGKVSYKRWRIDERSRLNSLGVTGLHEVQGPAFSVLRAKFDKWAVEKVREAGGVVASSTTVEGLIEEDGAIKGVVTDDDELRANVVIDASGVTSNLVEAAGLRGRLGPSELYHGVKHVFKLPPKSIEERFKVSGREGRAIFYMGEFMKGIDGGAFLYTNYDTLSIGIVVSLDSMLRRMVEKVEEFGKPLDVLEDLERHPMVSELIEGAELVEYSAHNIPKGYKCMLERPYRSGFLVTGDALGAFVKIGALIDGMRRAVASGVMAAQTYIRAAERGAFNEEQLAYYKTLLAPIYDDVRRSGRASRLSEGGVAYGLFARFALTVLAERVTLDAKVRASEYRDAVQRVQERTGLLNYYEDESYVHIKVDTQRASSMPFKPWVPACPVNCYTLVLDKGVFASYRDLYLYNMNHYLSQGMSSGEARRLAHSQMIKDIGRAKLRFDHVACVACGTCGAIGPRGVVDFNHERKGHGVRYRYG
ncbi:MAG: FAD-dependent oxidoreductase [Aigarchaeota archaeon]|nr:FAD-dependent oxidoreductase [Aigarchaeota archaeon]MDW8093096.1 FAD-dependent oxidoreductase [Nitrososphaerota archaeon]